MPPLVRRLRLRQDYLPRHERSRHAVVVRQIKDHKNVDGAFYRQDGQVYITVDDNLYIRDTSDGNSPKIHFDTDRGNLRVNDLNANGKVSTKTLQILNENQDKHGNTLILGSTDKSNLRLGYHQDYTWIQSHQGKPLAINTIGNNVGIGTVDPSEKLEVNGNIKAKNILASGDLTIKGKLILIDDGNRLEMSVTKKGLFFVLKKSNQSPDKSRNIVWDGYKNWDYEYGK